MRAATVALVASLVLPACTSPIATPAPSPSGEAATIEPAPSVIAETPRPSPLPTPTPLAPCPAPQKLVADVSVVPLCVAGANVFTENGIGASDLRLVFDQVTEDLAAVQQEFAWTLRGQPTIEVFATTATYTTALVHEFGYSGAAAAYVAEQRKTNAQAVSEAEEILKLEQGK